MPKGRQPPAFGSRLKGVTPQGYVERNPPEQRTPKPAPAPESQEPQYPRRQPTASGKGSAARGSWYA